MIDHDEITGDSVKDDGAGNGVHSMSPNATLGNFASETLSPVPVEIGRGLTLGDAFRELAIFFELVDAKKNLTLRSAEITLSRSEEDHEMDTDTFTPTETAPVSNGIHFTEKPPRPARTPAASSKPRVRKPKEKIVVLFKLGDEVRWSSSANGVTKEKTGKVVEVVAADAMPTSPSVGGPLVGRRNHESYVVLVGKEHYWPFASKLALAHPTKPVHVVKPVKAKKPAKAKVQAAVKAGKKVKASKKPKKPKAKVQAKAVSKSTKSNAPVAKTAAEKRHAAERTAAFVAAMKRREPNDKEVKVLKALKVGSVATIAELADKCFGGTKNARYLKVKNALRWLVATRHFKQTDRGTYKRAS